MNINIPEMPLLLSAEEFLGGKPQTFSIGEKVVLGYGYGNGESYIGKLQYADENHAVIACQDAKGSHLVQGLARFLSKVH